jgi:hypothetical protein
MLQFEFQMLPISSSCIHIPAARPGSRAVRIDTEVPFFCCCLLESCCSTKSKLLLFESNQFLIPINLLAVANLLDYLSNLVPFHDSVAPVMLV